MVFLQIFHLQFDHVNSLTKGLELGGIVLNVCHELMISERAHGLYERKEMRIAMKRSGLPSLSSILSQHFEFKIESD